MKSKLITIFVGLVIAFGAWVPLWMVEQNDPYANPFGLGLLTFAASVVGGIIAAVGFIRLVIYAFRRAN